MLETAVGSFAAFCTTVSYLPQVRKCWATGRAGDLSLRMFAILAVGVGTWIVYGFLKKDGVIMVSNGVSLSLLAFILFFKIREGRELGEPQSADPS